MTRAASYERVSLDRRDKRRSVTEQRADNLATIEREAWDDVNDGEAFTDNDRSASRFARKERPGYDRLCAFVEAGRCDVIVVWELSRLSRDLATLVGFRDLCRERSVLWSVGGRTYDPADDRDTWPLIAQAIQAENESAQTSKRGRRSAAARAAAGRPHGKLAYGYAREYDPLTRDLVRQYIDEREAAVLREMADRFLRGESCYSIGRDLTERHIPSPAGGETWHPNNVARLLRNPAYVARRMHHGQYVSDGAWPAIFDEQTWDLLQVKLSDPGRTHNKRHPGVKYLLVGIARCGKCKSQRMGTVKQSKGAYRAYMCKVCFGVARRMNWVDDHVEDKVVARLSSPDLADDVARRAKGQPSADVRGQADAVRARLLAFEDQAVAGSISAGAFARIEARLSEEIERLEVEARAATLPPAVRHLAVADPDRARALWREMTISERRDLLRALGADIEFLPTAPRRSFDKASVRVEFG